MVTTSSGYTVVIRPHLVHRLTAVVHRRRGFIPSFVHRTIHMQHQSTKGEAVHFLLVVVFTLVQGPTLPTFADRLGITAPTRTKELAIELAPLERLRTTMLTLDVPPGSRRSRARA